MYKISSTRRFSDEFLVDLSPAVKSPATDDDDLLQPVSDHRISDGNKKEVPSPSQQQQHKKSRRENVIHLIPIFLLLCALILWWFSVPLNKMKSPLKQPNLTKQLLLFFPLLLSWCWNEFIFFFLLYHEMMYHCFIVWAVVSE
ncbi:hypothetical protein ACSBR1_011045 [Camellia fascicularis]